MPSFSPRALLFDMDGTLVDSTAVVERQWKIWGDRHGIPLSQILDLSHGRPSLETIRLLAPHLPDPEAEADEHHRREELDTEGIIAVAGAHELIAQLQDHQWAVVTSAPRALALIRIRAAGLPDPPLLVSADIISRGKPDPEGYLLAAAQLNVDPADCLVFEDTPVGLEAARRAGMPAIALATTYSAIDWPCSIPNFRALALRRSPGSLSVQAFLAS